MESSETQPSEKGTERLKTVWKRFRNILRGKPATNPSRTVPAATKPKPAVDESLPKEAPGAGPREPATSDPGVTSSKPQTEHFIDETPILEVDDSAAEPSQTSGSASQSQQDPSYDLSYELPMHFNKAQAILARYNLQLTETSWDGSPKGQHERVHKSIRMRVRYTCHNCSTIFGHDRVCIGCQHRRCARCSRYPPRKNRTKPLPDEDYAASSQNVGDAPRVAANVVTCHECQTGLPNAVDECPQCHHRICERCLRDAAVPGNTTQERGPPLIVTERRTAGETPTAPS